MDPDDTERRVGGNHCVDVEGDAWRHQATFKGEDDQAGYG